MVNHRNRFFQVFGEWKPPDVLILGLKVWYIYIYIYIWISDLNPSHENDWTSILSQSVGSFLLIETITWSEFGLVKTEMCNFWGTSDDPVVFQIVILHRRSFPGLKKWSSRVGRGRIMKYWHMLISWMFATKCSFSTKNGKLSRHCFGHVH